MNTAQRTNLEPMSTVFFEASSPSKLSCLVYKIRVLLVGYLIRCPYVMLRLPVLASDIHGRKSFLRSKALEANS